MKSSSDESKTISKRETIAPILLERARKDKEEKTLVEIWERHKEYQYSQHLQEAERQFSLLSRRLRKALRDELISQSTYESLSNVLLDLLDVMEFEPGIVLEDIQRQHQLLDKKIKQMTKRRQEALVQNLQNNYGFYFWFHNFFYANPTTFPEPFNRCTFTPYEYSLVMNNPYLALLNIKPRI